MYFLLQIQKNQEKEGKKELLRISHQVAKGLAACQDLQLCVQLDTLV
jgi:hypothetical protein